MAPKWLSDKGVLNLMLQIEVELIDESDVTSACSKVGISSATYYARCKKYGGMAKSQRQEMKALEKENQRIKKVAVELELDKLILEETLDYLKPKT